MSAINSLINSQVTKNGVSAKRTNIGEILTLPVYDAGAFVAPTSITVQLYNYMPTAAFIVANNYFVMKNNNQIILYKSDGTTNNAIVTGNFTFTGNSNNIVKPGLIYNATTGGVIKLLNFFDTGGKVLYVNGVIETLTAGESFVADGKLHIQLAASLAAFAPS